MAPLLGRKPFPLVKPLPGEEPLFTIAHTQEAFRTREYPFPAAPAWPPAGWAGGSSGRGPRSPAPGAAVSVRMPAGLHRESEPAALGGEAGGGGEDRRCTGRCGAPRLPSIPRHRTLSPGLAVEERPPPPHPLGLALDACTTGTGVSFALF